MTIDITPSTRVDTEQTCWPCCDGVDVGCCANELYYTRQVETLNCRIYGGGVYTDLGMSLEVKDFEATLYSRSRDDPIYYTPQYTNISYIGVSFYSTGATELINFTGGASNDPYGYPEVIMNSRKIPVEIIISSNFYQLTSSPGFYITYTPYHVATGPFYADIIYYCNEYGQRVLKFYLFQEVDQTGFNYPGFTKVKLLTIGTYYGQYNGNNPISKVIFCNPFLGHGTAITFSSNNFLPIDNDPININDVYYAPASFIKREYFNNILNSTFYTARTPPYTYKFQVTE